MFYQSEGTATCSVQKDVHWLELTKHGYANEANS